MYQNYIMLHSALRSFALTPLLNFWTICVQNPNMGILNDKSYIGEEVYLINFQTKSISVPNNIIVYASLDDYRLWLRRLSII